MGFDATMMLMGLSRGIGRPCDGPRHLCGGGIDRKLAGPPPPSLPPSLTRNNGHSVVLLCSRYFLLLTVTLPFYFYNNCYILFAVKPWKESENFENFRTDFPEDLEAKVTLCG